LDFLKKKTFGYKERNEKIRETYELLLKEIPKEKRVYIDETGIDDNEVSEYGWGLIGERVFDMKRGEKTKRYSVVSGLLNNQITAPFVFEGTCCRELFEHFLEKVLLPIIPIGSVLIMDNASFHKGGKIKDFIKNAGCKLLYLPAYSPDLNPIEHHWARVKQIIKKHLVGPVKDFYELAITAFDEILSY